MIARERDAKALVRRKLIISSHKALTGERIRARAQSSRVCTAKKTKKSLYSGAAVET